MKSHVSRRKLLSVLREVEAAHFRTEHDTGASSQANLVWNALRRRLGLPYLDRHTDLPKWDEARRGYFMPKGSKLLTARAALAKGGKV